MTICTGRLASESCLPQYPFLFLMTTFSLFIIIVLECKKSFSGANIISHYISYMVMRWIVFDTLKSFYLYSPNLVKAEIIRNTLCSKEMKHYCLGSLQPWLTQPRQHLLIKNCIIYNTDFYKCQFGCFLTARYLLDNKTV